MVANLFNKRNFHKNEALILAKKLKLWIESDISILENSNVFHQDYHYAIENTLSEYMRHLSLANEYQKLSEK